MAKINDPTVILSAVRTPIGKFDGYYRITSAIDLGAACIKATLDVANLEANSIEEVIMGCVLPAGLGQAPARQAALRAGVPVSAGCTTINKVCGSGMKAVMNANCTIHFDSKKFVIAGGMENMSCAPYLLRNARFGYRIGHHYIIDHMMLDGLEDAYDKGRPMGYFAEQCAKEFNFSREQQDQYALSSLERCRTATDSGQFTTEVVPITLNHEKYQITVVADEGLNSAKPEKIPLLKPAFAEDGTITAANSSSIADGAAALLLCSESQATEMSLPALAKIVGQFNFAQEPAKFTTAPIGAIRGLLQAIDWEIDQVDLFEINEAFAVVVLAAMQELKIDHSRVNVNGGACVMGHPIGASGARIIVTLVHALRHRGLKRGIACLCIGGGEATAIAVETL